MRIFKLATVLTMMLGASGCQTTYYDTGNGPITLSPSAARAFARYLEYQYPLDFAISEDGRTYHIYHCTGFNCNPGDAMAVSRCNERASKRGQVCKTFAIERDIVWKGKVRGLDSDAPKKLPESTAPASFSAVKLCGQALDKDDSSRWDSNYTIRAVVDEAKRRGFDPKNCREFLN
ncbi:MAG: hypothetical protein HOA30_11390 [Rhodospirillaceae bacterium]|nr:hypothetical protein [Rhodospirillaceae bacterium]